MNLKTIFLPITLCLFQTPAIAGEWKTLEEWEAELNPPPKEMTVDELELDAVDIMMHFPKAPNGTIIAEVTNVIDGDTIDVSTVAGVDHAGKDLEYDDWVRYGKNIRVRFANIDAPEYKQRYGRTAKKYLITMLWVMRPRINAESEDLYRNPFLGQYLPDESPEETQAMAEFDFGVPEYTYNQASPYVYIVPKRVDKFGRLVAEVYFPNFESVEEGMLSLGLAWKLPHCKNKAMAKAEQVARANKRIIWRDKNPVPPWKFRAPAGGASE